MRKQLFLLLSIFFLALAPGARVWAETEASHPDDDLKVRVENSSDSAWDKSNYAGIILGYGGFFPVADYAAIYKPAHLLSVGVPVYYLTFWHICPELGVRYAPLDSEFDPLRYNSTMSLVEIFPALLFRWDFALPDKFRGPVQVFARIYDGVTRVGFTSVDPYFPFLSKKQIVEYINIFGISAGCNYFVYRGLFVGLELDYSVIATAGSPLQAISFTMQAGYRFL